MTEGIAHRIIDTFQFMQDAQKTAEANDEFRSRNKGRKFSPAAVAEVRLVP